MPTLSDAAIRAAKPREKPYKLFDERGLFLLIKPNGSRLWRFRYSVGGREKLLALGTYPDVSLKRARERRDEARRLVADGKDPNALRRDQKAVVVDTFEALAREWHAKQAMKWDDGHAQTVQRRLEAGLFPWLGSRPVASIEPPELLQVLRRTESRGAVETAHRLLQHASKIFRYAIATGRAKRDPAADVRGALAPIVWKPRAAILIPARVGELLRAIDGYEGQPATMAALRLAPLVFVRPGELRAAEWSEFGLDDAEWRIPAQRMKMDRDHLVPLATQAVHILREIERITGSGRLVFPSVTHADRPLSENTINASLRRMGFDGDTMTAHGFRAMAATLLSEQGFSPDVIERQLAHTEQDRTKAAYQRSQFLDERRKMMQAWADYLDGLRTGAKVVAIKSSVPGRSA